VQPHNQDGVIHVAMKRMPHIITEGNAQVFKLQLPWFKTVRLILCALNAKSRALSAIRFIREIAKLNFVVSAQYFTQENVELDIQRCPCGQIADIGTSESRRLSSRARVAFKDTFTEDQGYSLHQALAPSIGISNLARHLEAQNRIVSSQMWASQELSTFAMGVAMSVRAAVVSLHVLHALIRTFVVR
jgi:hypothetical protein